MKKNIVFVSEDNIKVSLDIETRPARSSRPIRDWDTLEPVETPVELSISGECGGCAGQCCDDFEPTEAQSKLVAFWKKYHLNNCCAGTKAQTEALKECDSHDYKDQCAFLEERGLLTDRGYKYGTGWLYKSFPQDELDEIIAEIENEEGHRTADFIDIVLDDEDEALEYIRLHTDLNSEHVLVILKNLGLSVSEIDNIEQSYGRNSYTVYGTDYLVGTEDELAEIAYDRLDRDMWVNAVQCGATDDSFEEWKEDCISEDLGGILNGWDGTIDEEDVNGTWYSICRS